VATYYCHGCAVVNGTLQSPPQRETLTDTEYKLDKYIKHTMPSSSSDYKTVFTGVSSETYQKCIVTAVCSGHVQIDSKNRVNVVWVGSEDIGISLQGGKYIGPTSAVKVVCHSNSSKVHGYPIPVSELKSAVCAQCGREIPY